MPQPVLHVLLIEDNPGDAELVKETLADLGSAAFELHHAEALLPGLDRMAQGDIDLVLLDLSLPDSRGLDGLNAVRLHAPSTPVVVLTGLDSEALALRAVQGGAQDYLVKGALQGPALARTLQYAVVRQKLRAEPAELETRPERARVVGFLGAKGGVGTTTIACHTAKELWRQTKGRVLLMDLDMGANAIGFLMNVVNAPYGIVDASNDILHLDEDRWRKLTAPCAESLDVIRSGGPVFREDQQPMAERVRFVLRFVRTLYQWIVIDLGRVSPFSVRLAEEAGFLYLVSAGDILALNEVKSAAGALYEAGIDPDRLSLVLNQPPVHPGFSRHDLQKILGLPVQAMLPECSGDFLDSAMDGKRLGESRKFQKQIAAFAAGIAGVEGDAVKVSRPFLPRVLQNVAA